MGFDERVRFHLSFEYINPEKGWKNTGNQVVWAEDLDHAASVLMQERKLSKIHIKQRFHNNGQVDDINRDFMR